MTDTKNLPIGSTHRDAADRRSRRSRAYRDEFDRIAPYEALARLVIGKRMEHDLSQQELADRMGTSHSVISRIESGRYPTSVTTLKRLAGAFGAKLVIGFDESVAAHEAAEAGRTLQAGKAGDAPKLAALV
jgi:ribosome-binding protein aMBF1 (putative translation factor)